AQCPAGSRQRAGRAGDRATRPRRGVVLVAVDGRRPVAASAGIEDRELRSGAALSSSPRYLVRRTDTGRALRRPVSPERRPSGSFNDQVLVFLAGSRDGKGTRRLSS